MISALASITVVIYISHSMQTSVTTVDRKSSMTIDLRQALGSVVGSAHQLIDIGSPAAEPFLLADGHAVEMFTRARATYDTAAEQTLLARIESEWDALAAPFRVVAEDPVAADRFAAIAGADPLAKSNQHFDMVAGQARYEAVFDTLHSVSRQAIREDLGSASTLAWWLVGFLVVLFSASVGASIYFARRMSRIVGNQADELRYQALHDTLTGLPNRALIADRIEQLLARNRRTGTEGAALFVDLDEFKNVNDTLGHAAGDRLLREVATRMSAALRDADTIGRMGGDEFVILIDGGAQHASADLVAERLIEVMREPFALEGAATPIVVTTSIGIATGDRATPGDLLRDADVALYQAKAAGKNCFATFCADMQASVHHRSELELDLDLDLRAALDAGQFHLA